MTVLRRVIPAAPGIPALEPIKQDLYDTKEYPAAGASVLEFYRNPAAGELNSNMAASGQLPHPQQFHAMGIAVEMLPEVAIDSLDGAYDAWAANKKKIREGAWIKLHIGAKDYLTLPLKRVPEGVGPSGFAAGADATPLTNMFLTNGVQDLGHYYDLTIRMAGKVKPIHIPSQQSFFVQIYWPTLIPHAFASAEHVLVRVYLVGILWREVQ